MAQESNIFRGTFPALVTPMLEDGNRLRHGINKEVMEQLVYFVLDNGCEGVLAAGCTGHAASLSTDEQVGLIGLVNNIVSDYNRSNGTNKLVIGGDGASSTYDTLEFAKRVEGETGVLYHLMISPFTNKPSPLGIIQHYTAVADNINGLIIMYSVPGRTGGSGILTESAAELASHPRIVGIKEASGDTVRIRKTIEGTRDLDFVVLSGDDSLNTEIIEMGGTGTISVAANIDPKRTSDSVRYALSGDYAMARQLDQELQGDNQSQGLYKSLFLAPDGNPVMAHYALRQMGFKVGIPRLPLVDACEANKRIMDDALSRLNLLNLVK